MCKVCAIKCITIKWSMSVLEAKEWIGALIFEGSVRQGKASVYSSSSCPHSGLLFGLNNTYKIKQ